MSSVATDPGESNSVGTLTDRAEINDLLLRYAKGVRQDDPTVIASVFTEDAVLIFPRGPVSGIENIESYFRAGLGPDKAKRMGFDVILDTTPAIANVDIEFDGDSAHCESSCFSLTTGTCSSAVILTVMGQRIVDELVRTASSWRIKQRERVVLWQTDLPVSSPLEPS